MSDIDQALAAGLETALLVAGRDLVYHRDTDTLAFRAIPGRSREQATDGIVIVAEVVYAEWIFETSNLAVLDPPEPGKTDWVEVDGKRYDLTEKPRLGYWKAVTPDGTWLRIYTTEIGPA